MKKPVKIAVGMSGGVDSTMAAFLLKQQGYEVIGITMSIWGGDKNMKANKSGCYGPGEANDIKEAKRAARIIGIPHYVIDLKKEYHKKVIEYFKSEYKAGKTPNPCVVCNSKIKFGLLVEKANNLDFDYFATGHYARIVKNKNVFLIKKGIDKSKDQSYFLNQLKQKQLNKIIFPLGEMYKKDVKILAIKNGFKDFADKKESQNFSECDSYSNLLGEGEKGKIISYDNNILGEHKGIENYTLGQRKNLNIGGLKEPYYVLKIDVKNNSIIVGPKSMAYSDDLSVKNINWIIPLKKKNVKVKIRYGAEAVDAVFVKKTNSSAVLRFKKPQFAVSPGQSAVFYDKDIMLGGGVITSSSRQKPRR